MTEFGENLGSWEFLSGPYHARFEFRGGASDPEELRQLIERRATDQGWRIVERERFAAANVISVARERMNARLNTARGERPLGGSVVVEVNKAAVAEDRPLVIAGGGLVGIAVALAGLVAWRQATGARRRAEQGGAAGLPCRRD